VYWYLRARGSPGNVSKRLGLWEHRNRVCAKPSGGMRQRVLIASALAVPAEMYLPDEPTAGLDPLVRGGIWEVLREVSK